MMKKQYITIIFAVLGLILGLGSCKKDKIAPNRQQIAFIKYFLDDEKNGFTD